MTNCVVDSACPLKLGMRFRLPDMEPKVNHDKMVKLDLRDSELRAVSVSENNYSV
jgi:hypothetical protein